MNPEELHKALSKSSRLNKMPISDRLSLLRFTDRDNRRGEDFSRRLNDSLSSDTPIHPQDMDMHHAIREYATPSDRKYEVYSGTMFNNANLYQPRDIITTKAHISTSHDMEVGMGHADKYRGKDGISHMNHISIVPGNNVLYVGSISKHPMEYETIIPSGTKMQYINTTYHTDTDGKPLDVHHFTIQ